MNTEKLMKVCAQLLKTNNISKFFDHDKETTPLYDENIFSGGLCCIMIYVYYVI